MNPEELKAALEARDNVINQRLLKIEDLEVRNADLLDRIEEIEARGSILRSVSGSSQAFELKALRRYLETGDKAGLEPAEAKDMSIAGGAAAGGAMVPEVIAQQIINRAIARSRLVSLVQNTPVSNASYVRLVNLRGATGAWSGELGTRNATATPQLREVKPTHGELYAYPSVTRWLVQDAQFNIERFLSDNVEDVFSKSLENVVLFGDGTDKPTGMLNTAPVATADGTSPERDADTIQFVAGTDDLADDIISLFFSLKPEYRANATFAMSSASLATARKLKGSDGQFIWQQNLSASIDAPDGLLLGRPVVTTEELPIVGASPANNAILCGDFMAGYELVRIGGMSLIRDEVTQPGRIKLYWSQRFGGRLTDNDAVKVLQA